MARCIGARTELRTYSTGSATQQVKSGLMGLGGRRVLEELSTGLERVSRGTLRGTSSTHQRAAIHPPLEAMAGSILMSPRPSSTSSRIGRAARSEIPQARVIAPFAPNADVTL